MTARARAPVRLAVPLALCGLASACGATLLAGCLVGPDYHPPPVKVPVAFKEGEGFRPARPQDDALRGPWWTRFGDPALDGLQRHVLISNQTLALAEAQFRAARSMVSQARAAYFPVVTVGASITRFQSSSTVSSGAGFGSSIGTGGAAAGQDAGAGAGSLGGSGLGGVGRAGTGGGAGNLFSFPFSVSWEPDLWGRVRRSVESARAGAQASRADLENVRLSVRAELALSYFQLRTLDAQRRLLDETVAAYARSLELTRQRLAAGVVSATDVTQAETQLKSSQAQALDLGVQRAQLEHAIAVLLGRPPAEFKLPFDWRLAGPPPAPRAVPSMLLERRPDIAGAERRMAAANAQIGVATAAYFPSITLGASAGFVSSSVADWFRWPSHFWSVGPSASATVIDGGLRGAQIDQARANYEASVATYRQTVLAAFQGVEDNLAALRILAEEARVQDEAVRAAQRALTLILEQYKAGTVSYLNVITAQTILLTNRTQAVQILGRRLMATVQLVQALGGGWVL